jgi:hypothetical protein
VGRAFGHGGALSSAGVIRTPPRAAAVAASVIRMATAATTTGSAAKAATDERVVMYVGLSIESIKTRRSHQRLPSFPFIGDAVTH